MKKRCLASVAGIFFNIFIQPAFADLKFFQNTDEGNQQMGRYAASKGHHVNSNHSRFNNETDRRIVFAFQYALANDDAPTFVKIQKMSITLNPRQAAFFDPEMAADHYSLLWIKESTTGERFDFKDASQPTFLTTHSPLRHVIFSDTFEETVQDGGNPFYLAFKINVIKTTHRTFKSRPLLTPGDPPCLRRLRNRSLAT